MNRLNPSPIAWWCPAARIGVTMLALGVAMFPAVPVAATETVVQHEGAVSYVSGGVADDSLDQMKSMSRDFNLKLVFALTSGAFLSDVDVAIADAKGNPVLVTTSEGPWLLAKLPPGSYQVVATESGNSIKRRIAVGGGKLSTVDFRWLSE